jgi:hypothetical protein
LTAKYIFQCKLTGEPVEIYADKLTKRKLKFLTQRGVWKDDPLFTQKFWDEYSFTLLSPIRVIDSDGKATYLCEGDHFLACL